MTKYRIIIPVVLGLFIWQGVADAASISTRVRILESKIAKQDRKIKQSLSVRTLSDSKIEKGLKKVNRLEKKMNRFIKESQDAKKRRGRTDKRYAFP